MSVSERGAAQRMAWQIVLALNVAATGVLLGQLQWGVMFMLQSYLASTAIVYLLGTCFWLIGSLIGLAVPGRRGEFFWAAGMVLAYYAFRTVAMAYPYRLGCLPFLLVMIAAMGCYAGRFFRYRAQFFPEPKWLFFIENCGFVAGIVFTIGAMFHTGSSALFSMPLISSALVLVTAVGLPFHPAGRSTP